MRLTALVVVHMGGGVSVAAHSKGKVVDVNNALYGEGPFSPERTGGIAAMQLADACYSGKYTLAEMKKIISGKGGVVAHLGTNSFKEVEDRVAAGDKEAKLIADAFIYNVAKARHRLRQGDDAAAGRHGVVHRSGEGISRRG